MANNFLAQVKETEQKTAEMIEKAIKKAQSDLLKYKQELEKNKEEELAEAREKMRQELQKAKIKAKENYEEKVAEGEVEVKKFESEKINSLSEFMDEGVKFFLSLI